MRPDVKQPTVLSDPALPTVATVVALTILFAIAFS